MLEKSQFKFKYHQPKGNSKKSKAGHSSSWSNTYYSVINGDEFSKGTSISKVNRRLDNIENILSNVIPNMNRVMDRKESKKVINKRKYSTGYYHNESNADHKGAIASHYSDINTLGYEDYPKHMLSFYFTMQAYCSFPPVIDLDEFFQCIGSFSNTVPDFLMSAIVSHACLNSPHPLLYLQNIVYSDYYYQLSILQMSRFLISPNIYIIQALLILSTVDEACSRSLQKFERVTSAVKLSQTMGMDKHEELIDGFMPDHFMNVPKATVKKLWVIVKTIDWEISKAKSCPPLIQSDDNWILPAFKPFEDQALVQRCKSSLSQDYTQLFSACAQFSKLVIPAFVIMEQDLSLKPAIVKLRVSLNVLSKLNEWQESLGQSVKFTIDCLNPEAIKKQPQLRLRLILYQKMLEICMKIYQYAIYYSSGLDLKQILPLIQSALEFGRNLVNLLEGFQFSNFKHNLKVDNSVNEDRIGKSDKANLNLELFNTLGGLYLNMIQLLRTVKVKGITEYTTLTAMTSMIHASFNTLIQYMTYCTSLWTNSQGIINGLITKYADLVELESITSTNSKLISFSCNSSSLGDKYRIEEKEKVEFCFCFYCTP